jgi:hypothetical protein
MRFELRLIAAAVLLLVLLATGGRNQAIAADYPAEPANPAVFGD